MLLNKGIPLKEAYNWNPCGCVETNLEGKQRCYTAYADFNLGSAVEFALLNGKSRKYGIQASEATGDPTAFNTYEEFEEAVKEQIRYELRGTVASSHVCDDIGFQRVVPALSLSFYLLYNRIYVILCRMLHRQLNHSGDIAFAHLTQLPDTRQPHFIITKEVCIL